MEAMQTATVRTKEVLALPAPPPRLMLPGLASTQTTVEPEDRVVLRTKLPTTPELGQMVEDLERNGVIGPVVEPEKPVPRGDMAQMLEDLARGQELARGVPFDSSGRFVTLAMFDKPLMVETDSSESREFLPVAEPHHEGHEHGRKDAAMSGHLGAEAVEMAGHKAGHHGAQVAGEVKGHVAGEVVAESKAHVAGELAATGKAKVAAEAAAHGKAKIAAEAAVHGKSHAASTATDALHTAQDLCHDPHQVCEPGQHLAEAAHHGSELSSFLQVALDAGAGLSLGVGGFMAYVGVKELKHAVHNIKAGEGTRSENAEQVLEGVGAVTVGARSVAAAVTMVGLAHPALAAVGHTVGQALPVLGVVHGGVDVVLGVKNLAEGKKIKGALELGFGLAVIATAAGGGPIALAAAGVALAGKIAHRYLTARREAA